MYESVFRNLLFPLYESVLRGRPTLKHLKRLEQQQWLAREQLEAIQWSKLQKLLGRTFQHVPYYREQWNSLGIRPEDIRTPEDFAQLPVLSKADIRCHRAELEAEDYRGRNRIQSGTGGSTGESLRFTFARDVYEWRIASAARSDRWVGWDFGCKEAYIWGQPLVPLSLSKRIKRNLYHAWLHRRIWNSYEFSQETLPRFAAELAAYRPDFIVGYANPLALLARCALEHGIRMPTPRGIIATAEMVYDFQKRTIEQAFGCKVINRYGCREVMLIAAQCEHRGGLHLNSDNIYVEFVRGDGSHCPSGEVGRILLTDLNNYGMPFIRYEVGDLGAPLEGTCPCGRNLPLMDMVAGRTLDIMQLPGGRSLTGLFFTHLLLMGDYPGLAGYQFEQTARDRIVARLVRGPGWKDNNVTTMQRILQKNLGDHVQLAFEFVDKIPLTRGGKWRPIVGLAADSATHDDRQRVLASQTVG